MKKNSALVTAYKSDKVLPAEWIAVGLISAVMLIAFSYIDLTSLTVWSVNLLDVTFEGKIYEYYVYSAENVYGLAHGMVGCEITAILPLAIWNIPIWIMQRFFGLIIAENYLMLLWSHLFFVVLLGFTCLFVHKICYLLTGDKTKCAWAVILTASSVFTYSNVYYAAQNDILYILLGVIAVYYYLKEDDKLFYLYSALSISVKPFFLFAYIALLLLKEKNLFKIIAKALLSVSVLGIVKLIFLNAPLYKESLSYGPTGLTIDSLLSASLQASYPNASLFIIALVVIYFFCYTANTTFSDDLKKYTLYTCTAVYTVMLTFAADTFYRPMILMPFMIMMFLSNKQYLRLNMILASVMNGSWLILLTTRNLDVDAYNVAYVADNAVMRFLSALRGSATEYFSIGTEFNADLAAFLPAIAGIAVACAILILIINFPDNKFNISHKNKRCERWIMWVYMYEFAIFLLDFFRIYFR